MPIDQVAFNRHLFNPSKDKVTLLLDLKREHPFETVYSVLKGACTHPVVKNWVFGTPFPNDYDDLRKDRILGNSGNLPGEIAWNLLPCVIEHTKISGFIAAKNQFEKHILLGNYTEASELITSIETQYGKSVWVIEAKLLLTELKEGTEGNWLALSETAGKLSDALLLYFVENYSKRIESKITYSRYRDLFFSQIGELSIGDEFREYLIYRLNYLGARRFINFDYFLSTESAFSLPDRYLTLRQVITEIAIPDNYPFLKKFLQKAKVIQDPLLSQLSNLSGYGQYFLFSQSTKFLELVEKYTLGQYDLAMGGIKEEIVKDPTSIELYDLYAKSNIESKQDFINPNISTTIDNIIRRLYDIYARGEQVMEAIEDLLKIITIHFSTDWAKQLLSLLSNISDTSIENQSLDRFYILFSKLNNPKNLRDYDSTTQNPNREQLKKHYPNLISIEVLESIEKGDIERIDKLQKIPGTKVNLYHLKALYQSQRFFDAIKKGEEVITQNISTYVKEEALIILFKSYLQTNNLQKALLLYVDSHLANTFIVKRLNARQLEEKISNTHTQITSLIEFPLFQQLRQKTPYEIYVAYDTFLSNAGYTKPSELLANTEAFENQKLIMFLKEVCSFEVLKHSYHFASREEIENERMILLGLLLKLDKENEPTYIREITALAQSAAIKKAISEVNKAKITINVEQLMNAESSNIRVGFNRYIELANFSKNRQLHGIDISNKQLLEHIKNLNNEIKSKFVYTNDPAFISFKVMLLDVRDKFLFSKEYGLDGYLSTRIRHGTFQNYIRSVFESENLISQRNIANEYLDIEFWKSKIPYYLNHKVDELQAAIHEFSKQIDEYTEYIIKELIQVKTEKNEKKPNALFNYSMTNNQLAALFQLSREKVRDHKTFITAIFNFLTDITEEILQNIKHVFLTEISDSYTAIITQFHDRTKTILNNISFPELTSAIMKCNTLLDREIRNITEWFNISKPTTDTWLDMNTIIQTSIQITNRIYPYRNINPKVSIDVGYAVSGSINLIYITRILLDNIIQHSRLPISELKIGINVSTTADQFLKLSFTNNLDKSSDLQRLTEKLSEVRDNWKTVNASLEKTDIEGGSGFEKILRILTFDMRNKDHRFDFSIEDHNVTIDIFMKIKVNE